MIDELIKIARDVMASTSEKEVERLLRFVLRGTPFSGKTFGVGGYVRDEVLGIDAKDLDIVVEMNGGAEKITKFLHGKYPTETSTPRKMGAAYPIWQITFKDDIEYKGETFKTSGAIIEFADTQKESFPDSDSRQREVQYGDLREDVERRDFTVNMLMKDLTTGEIVDLTGISLQDIKKGILRGHPNVDFNNILSQDPLRMIRLVRFSVKYGWNVPLSVLKSVKRNASRIKIVSGERIRDELIKIMNLGKLAQAVRLMKVTGLLQYVLPEINIMKGVEHEYSRGSHQEGDVYRHTLAVLRNAKPGVESQLAALLHDVGKPSSQEVIGGLIKFIGHEKVGAEIAEAIMRRLKFDSTVVNKVKMMVRNHMKPHFFTRESVGPAGLRRFIRDVGEELVDAVLDLAEADQLGMLPPSNLIPQLGKEIDAIRVPVQQAEKLPIDGRDVQRILGIKPGKIVGEILDHLKTIKYEWELKGKTMTKTDAEHLVMEKYGKAV